MITIYATFKDMKEANKISKILLEKKFIACANIFPIKSMYWWNSKIQEDNEIAAFFKTSKGFETVCKEIKKLHSYDVPCIEKMNVSFDKDYSNWMKKVT